MFDRKITDALVILVTQMMETRRQARKKSKEEGPGDTLDFFITLMDKVDTPEFKKLKITKHTVVAQAVMIFIGGQDQISTIVAVMIYNLLLHPEIEASVYRELDKVVGKINYETLSQLPYLQACITEAARLNPFFSRTERVCTRDWDNDEFNLHIKKGMVVQINIWACNRNPKYFTDPDKFSPDRFLPGRKEKLHPYAMTSWGFGPRGCFGQKFSFDMMLLVSAFILRNFKFHLRSDSKPEYVPAGPVFTPHMPFYFDVTTRA